MAKKTNKYKGPQFEAFEATGINAYLGLGRPFNFDDKKEAALLPLALAAGVAHVLYTGASGDYGAMALVGGGVALLTVLSYMLARELDPDRPLGALIAAFLTAGVTIFLGAGNYLEMLWLLFILRLLTRTSGDRHRIADNVLIIGCAVWLGKEGFWLYPVLTGAVYVLESQITGGYFRSLYLGGIALAGAALAEYNVLDNTLNMDYVIALGFGTILFLPELRVAPFLRAKGDKNGLPISCRRLQAAQGAFIIGAFLFFLFHGNLAVKAFVPALAALYGCAIGLFIALVRHQVDFSIRRR